MIGLIACSAKKLGRAAPARELYDSALFKKSLAYAEQHCEVVYVLSAKHGLVALDTVLDPYDTRINGGGTRFAASWGHPIAEQLFAMHGDALYLILAGQNYVRPIENRLRQLIGKSAFIANPLDGMGFGDRLSFLNAQIVKPRTGNVAGPARSA